MKEVLKKETLKKALISLTLSLAICSSAKAENQFLGGFSIFAQTGTCPEGDMVGQNYLARFRPRNVADGYPHSDFNLFGQNVALGHRLLNGAFTPAFKKVQSTFVGGGSGTDLTADSTTFILFTTQTAVNDDTKVVSVNGKIKGFDGQPACTVSFLFSGVKRFDF